MPLFWTLVFMYLAIGILFHFETRRRLIRRNQYTTNPNQRAAEVILVFLWPILLHALISGTILRYRARREQKRILRKIQRELGATVARIRQEAKSNETARQSEEEPA